MNFRSFRNIGGWGLGLCMVFMQGCGGGGSEVPMPPRGGEVLVSDSAAFAKALNEDSAWMAWMAAERAYGREVGVRVPWGVDTLFDASRVPYPWEEHDSTWYPVLNGAGSITPKVWQRALPTGGVEVVDSSSSHPQRASYPYAVGMVVREKAGVYAWGGSNGLWRGTELMESLPAGSTGWRIAGVYGAGYIVGVAEGGGGSWLRVWHSGATGEGMRLTRGEGGRYEVLGMCKDTLYVYKEQDLGSGELIGVHWQEGGVHWNKVCRVHQGVEAGRLAFGRVCEEGGVQLCFERGVVIWAGLHNSTLYFGDSLQEPNDIVEDAGEGGGQRIVGSVLCAGNGIQRGWMAPHAGEKWEPFTLEGWQKAATVKREGAPVVWVYDEDRPGDRSWVRKWVSEGGGVEWMRDSEVCEKTPAAVHGVRYEWWGSMPWHCVAEGESVKGQRGDTIVLLGEGAASWGRLLRLRLGVGLREGVVVCKYGGSLEEGDR